MHSSPAHPPLGSLRSSVQPHWNRSPQMRTVPLKLLATLAALLILGAAPAFANVDRPMQSHPGAGELHTACDANGGSFSESNDMGIHLYSCSKSNCDGKGGTCSVNCGDKGCTGNTPAIIVHANIRMIL